MDDDMKKDGAVEEGGEMPSPMAMPDEAAPEGTTDAAM